MKFRIKARCNATVLLGEVEADSPEEALSKTGDFERGQDSQIGVCWQCSDFIEEINIEEVEAERIDS